MSFLSFLVTLSFLRPSWWWSLISRRSETDYDLILSRLAKDISEAQARLQRIRTRDARASVLFTLYALAVWAAVVAFSWSIGWLDWGLREGEDAETRATRTLLWIPLALAPVGIFFTRRIVRWWYHRLAEAEETHIRTLRKTQRDKIDEIKAATRYDRLRLLLEKYDDSPSNPKASSNPSGGGNRAGGGNNPNARPSKSATPNSYRHSTPDATTLSRNGGTSSTHFPQNQSKGGSAPQTANLNQNQNQPFPPSSAPAGSNNFPSNQRSPVPNIHTTAVAVQPPGPRTWMDKLGDALLGADPSQMTAEQRYALICEACYAHNGLALKEEIEEIQYVCPRCGHFNSRRPSSTPVSSPFGRRNRLDSSATHRERVNSNASRFSFNLSSLTGSGGGGTNEGNSNNDQSSRAGGHNSNQSLSNQKESTGHPYALKPDGRAYSVSHSDLSNLSMKEDSNTTSSPSRITHKNQNPNSLTNQFGLNQDDGDDDDEEDELEELEEKEGTPKPDRYRKGFSKNSTSNLTISRDDWGVDEDDSPPPTSPLMKENYPLHHPNQHEAAGESGSPTNLRSRRGGKGDDDMDLD